MPFPPPSKEVVAGMMFLLIVGAVLYAFARQAGALSVASGDGIVIYGVSGNTTPQWRTYSNSNDTFGAESATVASTTGLSFVIRTAPTKQEAIAGYINSSGNLNILCYDGTNWTNEWAFTVGGTGTDRRFDIAYEASTSDVLVLFSTNAGTTNELAYRTKAGTTGCGAANWGARTNFDAARTSGVVQWVKMVRDPHPTSTVIAAAWADANSDISAAIWSGSALANEPTAPTDTNLEIVAASQDVDDFDLDYESLSGDLMIVWANALGANGTNGVRARMCTGGTASCTWQTSTTPATFADDATHLELAANPLSDEMVFASIGNAGSDLQAGYWSGTGWTNTANIDTATETPGARMHYVSAGWVTSGGTTRAILVYHDSNDTVLSYRSMTTAGVWSPAAGSAPSTFSTTPALSQGTNVYRWYNIRTDPFNTNRLMVTVQDNSSDMSAKRLSIDATPTFTWTDSNGASALTSTSSAITAQPFFFSYWNFIPAATVSCATDASSVSLGTLTTGSISTGNVNASTTMTCDGGNGCTLYVRDANAGLSTSSPAYTINSTTATLSAGTEGYGLNATTTSSGSGGALGMNSTYGPSKWNTNQVGGLTASNVLLTSSTAAVTGRETVAQLRAAISGTTPPGTFTDTLTFECLGN